MLLKTNCDGVCKFSNSGGTLYAACPHITIKILGGAMSPEFYLSAGAPIVLMQFVSLGVRRL